MNSIFHLLTILSASVLFFYTIPQADCLHAADDISYLPNIQKLCRQKSGVSDEVFEQAMKLNMDVNDRNLQCYTSCLFQELGTMDKKNGNINVGPFIKLLGAENNALLSGPLMACQEEVDETDLCKKGMQMYECFQRKAPSTFYFI